MKEVKRAVIQRLEALKQIVRDAQDIAPDVKSRILDDYDSLQELIAYS